MFEEAYSTSGFLELLIASRQPGSVDFEYGWNQSVNNNRIGTGYTAFNFSKSTFQGRGNEITRKAMLINASVPISAYGMSQWYGSAEAYMALPVKRAR